MYNKRKKSFDSVQMVREIRNAYYQLESNPDFSMHELKKIKEKWTELLSQQEIENVSTLKNKSKNVKNRLQT